MRQGKVHTIGSRNRATERRVFSMKPRRLGLAARNQMRRPLHARAGRWGKIQLLPRTVLELALRSLKLKSAYLP